MTTYQKVPVTLDPHTVIPADALPSAGLDEEGAAVVQEASEVFASETAVGVDVTVAGREATVTLSPPEDFEEGFAVDWDFGNGRHETGPDLVQTCTYQAAGRYAVTAVVSQPSEPSFAVDTPVVIED
jgi:PKD repeat protein